jgi:glutamate-ammonia-ligase adenylyltransferase
VSDLPTHRQQTTLTELAKLGFTELGDADALVKGLAGDLVPHFAYAADADQALRLLGELRERAGKQLDKILAKPDAAGRLIRILGASRGLAEFFLGHPEVLSARL